MSLATILIDQGAPGRGAPEALRWMADWLPDADRRTLTTGDLARIDAYAGAARDLHDLLPALLPLARPVWYEAEVTAAGGTRMIMGYGAVPAADKLDIGWACWSPASRRILGPLGPVRLTTAGLDQPAGMSDASMREMQTAAGIVVRALLMGVH